MAFRDFLQDDDLEPGALPLRGFPLRRGINMAAANPPEFDPAFMPDSELGIDDPELDQFQESEFDVDPVDVFLERLASGGLPQGLQRPQGFLQGLVSGVATGVVGRGQRTAERRKKFETAQAKRAAERDKANLTATQKYREQRGQALRDMTKAQREEKRKQDEYNRDNPPLSASLLEAAPWLGRAFKPGDNVPESVYKKVIENMSPEAVAELERKRKQDERDEKRLGMESRRLGIAEEELGIKRAEAAKPGGGKAPTEFQGKAQLMYTRARESADGATKGGLENRVLKKAWSLQAPPALQSDPDVREYWRAMESFTLALNRLESGANVTPTEFARVRQLYFVAPGDKEADIKAKAKMRATVVDELFKLQSAGAQQAQGDTPPSGTITPAQLWEP